MQKICLLLLVFLASANSWANSAPVASEYLRGKKLFEAGRYLEAKQLWSSLLKNRRSELNEAQVKALQGRVCHVDKFLANPLKKARDAYQQGQKLGPGKGRQFFKAAEKEALAVFARNKKSTEAAFIAAASILRQGSGDGKRVKLAYKLARQAVETKPGRTDELLSLFPKGELWDKLDGYARNLRIEKRQQSLWGEGGGEETERLKKENLAGVKFGGKIYKKKAYKRGNYRR